MEQMGLYQFPEAIEAAQTDRKLRQCILECGMKVPRLSKTEIERKKQGRITQYVNSPDDWHPNYGKNFNLVAVTWHPLKKSITVFGADDFGMELQSTTYEFFKEFCCNLVTINRCKELGFERF
jgi:hypothetical protein